MNATDTTVAVAVIAVTGVFGTAAAAFLTGVRSNRTTERGQDKTAEQAVLNVQENLIQNFISRISAVETKQTALEGQLAEERRISLDFREKLGLANVEIQTLKAENTQLKAQVATLQDEARIRKEEYQGVVSGQADEIKSLKDLLADITAQVERNSTDIGDIGKMEVAARSLPGSGA